MIANFTPNKNFTIPERFLTDKLLELFFNKTLDSHRAKLNNPRWILIELYQVLSDWHNGKIKAFEKTVTPVIHEAIQFVEKNSLIEFKPVDLKYYKELLGKSTSKDYHQLSYATKVLIENNKNYSVILFSAIESEIDILNKQSLSIEDLETLSIYADFLATDLINLGYSKGYLYSITSKIFGNKKDISFEEAFQDFKDCVHRSEENFTVVFKLNKLGGGNSKIDIKSPYEILIEKIKEFSKINEKSEQFFLKKNEFTYFLAMELQGKDYLSVIEKAKKEVFTLIDFIHMGYPDNPFDFSKKCLVIGTRKRGLTNIQPVFYVADGHYTNNEELHDLLLDKMENVSTNKVIQQETYQKVISAFRHLRLGRDADELEQKFLNYWIGLEYIFSNYDVHDTTIVRLKHYFIHAHSIAYIKRNLFEFHKDIKRLKLLEAIPNASDDLNYLKDINSYDYIINNFHDAFPLLAFRAHKYKAVISSVKTISEDILKHRTNLEWHLSRCYRIRNEIVHDAAIHLNIESITSNLKYYLTYVLNSLLDYLNTATNEINMNGQITINDYFLLQEIKYNSISKAGFKLDDLMGEKSATEIFVRRLI
jgi:hypothetical protein